MINKRKLLLASITTFCLGVPLVFAQQSSIQVSVGYGLPMNSDLIFRNVERMSYSNGTSQQRDYGTYGSYGAGFNLGVSYERKLSGNVGVEIGLQYLFGRGYDGLSVVQDYNTKQTDKISTSMSGLFISPVLVVEANAGKKVTPYGKIGLTLAFASIEEEGESSYNDAAAIGISTSTYRYTGGPSVGIRTGVGINIATKERVKWFFELLYTGITYWPDEGELTSLVVNNQNELARIPESARKTVFVDDYTVASPPTGTAQPNQSLAVSFPMSSLQLNAGIRFLISK